MSSTNRGRDRNALDFYETPPEVTRAILAHLEPARVVIDPCCGDRAILRVVSETWPLASCAGIDIDPARDANLHADALGPTPWQCRGTTVITNPPYSRAENFVRRSLLEAGPTGTVAMLLRLAFLESKGRAALHAEHPSDVFVLAKRPSFTGDGKSDSAAYAWFVWGPGRGGRWQVLP